jgi:integrase
MKLTKTRVDALKAAEREFFVWDGEIPGFGVRVRPTGAKSYVVKYRVHGGRDGVQRRSSIGKPSILPVEKARATAREILADVTKGGDPFGERQRRREAPTASEMFDRYMAEHSEVENRPATIKKNRALWRRNLEAAFGKRRVEDITSSDISRLKAQLKATPVEFNRCLSLLKTAFRLSVGWGWRVDNPASSVKPYKEEPRERTLGPDEIRRIARALNAMEAEGANPHAVAAVRLLAMLGWRISEVRSLRWGNIDGERAEALLPDTKTGTRTAALSPEVLDILRVIPRLGDFVIPGRDPSRPLGYEAVARLLAKVCKRSGVADITPHVFRASAATAMAESGASVFALRDAFGWKGLAMPNRYVKRVAKSAREALEQHGRRTAALLRGEDDAEVVDLVRNS